MRTWLRFKSNSSGRWLQRQVNDVHSKQAKHENYRLRAAYKLHELDDKFRLFTGNTHGVVDLGFAPGAWTQVALERLKKKRATSASVLGVDLITCQPPQGAHFITGDILSRTTHQQIMDFFGDKRVDVVMSDMMANTLGIKDNDHYASMDLCHGAMLLLLAVLAPGGSMVMKYYTGKEEQDLVVKMQAMFAKVYRFKPQACRNESRESYIIGQKRKQGVGVEDVFN